MKVILSTAISLDGYIDDISPQRLVLSSSEDLAAVKTLRASCDAILVGANTIRRDNPALAEAKTRVTITATGNLPPQAKFFQGESKKIVYCPAAAIDDLKDNIGALADIVTVSSLKDALRDLEKRGIKTLLVEGGTMVLTQFLSEGLAHELRLAIAPFFVGEKSGPRFVHHALFPYTKDKRAKLIKTEMLGDTAVLHYDLRKSNTKQES